MAKQKRMNGYIDEAKIKAAKQESIILGVLAFIFGIYLCARANARFAAHPDESLIMAYVMGLVESAATPLDVKIDAGMIKFLPSMAILALIIWMYFETKKAGAHYASDEVGGTAKFQTLESIKEYNKKFTEPIGKPTNINPKEGEIDSQNTIYSKHCALTMNTRHSHLNNNAMVIGGPGSGKSFNIVRPNLLQAYGSYVVTDPSGELRDTTGKFFESRGYDIRVFNLTDMSHSHRYNPFRYLRDESDVLTLIQCLIRNTDAGQKSSDPFWEKAETALLQAIIFYLIRYKDKSEQNFSMVSNYIRKARADGNKGKTKLDIIFDRIREIDPEDICVKQYDIFKQASEKTAQSILITAAVRLAPFNIEMVENLTREDDMNLKTIGDIPTITYIIVPQGENPYAFLVNMLYSQMFDTLYYHGANEDCSTREKPQLNYDVRFILDEFANIGVIPGFQQKLTTMRKYGLSCMIFIQAVGQIKNLYKDDWETLMGACDTLVYLGGNELSSMEDLSKKLGYQTIRVKGSSFSKNKSGGSSSHDLKDQKRELLTVDEIRRMEDGSCIVVIKGQQPFYDEKYKTFDHKNAKQLGNLGTGIGIYKFTYCNAEPKDANRLAENRKKLVKMLMQQSAASSNKGKKAVVGMPVSGGGTYTEEQKKEIVKDALRKLSPASLDDSLALENGGTIYKSEQGIVSKKSVHVRGVANAAGASVSGGATKPKMSDKGEGMMADLATAMFMNQ